MEEVVVLFLSTQTTALLCIDSGVVNYWFVELVCLLFNAFYPVGCLSFTSFCCYPTVIVWLMLLAVQCPSQIIVGGYRFTLQHFWLITKCTVAVGYNNICEYMRN